MGDGVELAWIDQVGAVVVVLFLVLGAFRGLWAQVLRLVGLGTAILVAREGSGRLVPHIERWAEELSGVVAQTLAWLILFTAVLLCVAALAKLGKKALEAMELGTWDRVGGAVAGALTGIGIHALLLVLMGILAPREWLGEVLNDTWSGQLEALANQQLRGALDARPAVGSYSTSERTSRPGSGIPSWPRGR
ncbi:MAG: CvpA family protein [Planctomycetota bacterium]|nr:CvpA family protein [Planctomycetota bacterium]